MFRHKSVASTRGDAGGGGKRATRTLHTSERKTKVGGGSGREGEQGCDKAAFHRGLKAGADALFHTWVTINSGRDWFRSDQINKKTTTTAKKQKTKKGPSTPSFLITHISDTPFTAATTLDLLKTSGLCVVAVCPERRGGAQLDRRLKAAPPSHNIDALAPFVFRRHNRDGLGKKGAAFPQNAKWGDVIHLIPRPVRLALPRSSSLTGPRRFKCRTRTNS